MLVFMLAAMVFASAYSSVLASPVDAPLAQTSNCPCSIWNGTITPTDYYRDPNPVELGVKFRSDVSGYILGVSFYKYNAMAGTHTGHLWSRDGTKLAEAVFTNETASGWQTVTFSTPVPIQANTTYIASYYSNDWIPLLTNYFATKGTDTPPLHALANGVDGPNGVYMEQGGFPSLGSSSTNYLVDVVFNTTVPPDPNPPVVMSAMPLDGLNQTNIKTIVTAKFSKALLPSSINSSTFVVRDAAQIVIPGTVTYNAITLTATFAPANPLQNAAAYTVTLSGGPSGIQDQTGIPMAADYTWSFTTTPAIPNYSPQGPGGPILLVTSAGNLFSQYYSEILKNEGFNEFTLADLSSVTAATLAGYDLVILGQASLTAAQVTMFTNWVQGGGNLIAMRPDKQLAGLLGLTTTTATLAEGYLLVNTASGPGVGIVNQTIQYHGTADLYGVGSATRVADLYSTLTVQANAPAVTINSAGSGKAAAFTYDLARSVVYQHQGNPNLAYQHTQTWQSQYIATDLFYPNWTDTNRITIPQADEQQRLLANMILQMNANHKPLPRFWYFPRGYKAVVIMTGDDHNSLNNTYYPGDTSMFFNTLIAASPPGCSVDNWECARGSSYLFTGNQLSNEQVANFTRQGFEIGIHSDAALGSASWCASWTPTSLTSIHNDQISSFAAKYWAVATQASIRAHCYSWYGYIDEQKVQYSFGIRLDTDIAYWPGDYVTVPAGFMNASGTPMRYADVNGAILDVYAAPTFVSDDNGTAAQPLPATINTLLDNAVGSLGYYGAFTVNMHSDNFYSWSYPGESYIIASAQARGVPIVSGRQMVTWLDGRNGSSFQNMAWNGSTLSFDVVAAPGSNGLQVLLPVTSAGLSVNTISQNNAAIPFHTETIKGIPYIIFNGVSAHYDVAYSTNPVAPVVTSYLPTVQSSSTASVAATTDQLTTARIDYGTSASSLNLSQVDNNVSTSHTFNLANLAKGTEYFFRITVQDLAGNSTVAPALANPPAAFLMPFVDTSVADFQAGALTNAYIASSTDGEVIPLPTEKNEFNGTALGTGWYSSSEGGTLTFSNGKLLLNGYLAGTSAAYPAGRSLEFSATFQKAGNQHIGFGTNFQQGPWAIFSTGSDGSAVQVRSNNTTGFSDNFVTLLPSSLFGTEHRYRIDWNPTNVVYYVDGVQVATHTLSFSQQMRPLLEDSPIDSYSLSTNWIRMGSYPTSATYLSRVFDAGQVVNWNSMTWTADIPSGASLTLSVRSGNTKNPDATWTAFTPLASSGALINVNAQYFQYSAAFTATNPASYPTLSDVTINDYLTTGGPPAPTPTPTVTPLPPTPTNTPLPPTPTDTPLPPPPPTATDTPLPPPPPTATDTPLPPPAPTATDTPLPPPPPTATDTPLPPPPPTATDTPLPPPPTATNTPLPPTPTNTPIPPSPTPTLNPDIIFADGFETGSLSRWSSSVVNGGNLSVTTAAAASGVYGMNALISNNTSMYVVDESPAAEARYRVRFYFNPNSVVMASGNAHYIFYALSANNSVIVRLELGYNGSSYRLRAGTANNNGSFTTTSWTLLSNTWHTFEFDWQASTSTSTPNGSLTLWIDGVSRATLSGLNNGNLRVERARLGDTAGLDSNTRGTELFDVFESRHQTYIGP